MAASVASSALFLAPAPASKNGTGGSSKDSLGMRGVAGNAGVARSSARLRAAVPKVSGGGGKAAVADGEDEAARPSALSVRTAQFYFKRTIGHYYSDES
jgi:fatty acyl-ACP thioesterase B